eukprot:GHVH01006754.1.p1 GENE.GHVH01006754.1~~GHVH01006754.1.p1  ORF type:complete len:181 (+),score=21.87 GHVH01006754.1:163-705(+)
MPLLKHPHKLWGGGFSVRLPDLSPDGVKKTIWLDSSKVRVVPDHQEVFTALDTEDALIFEILSNASTRCRATDIALEEWMTDLNIAAGNYSSRGFKVHDRTDLTLETLRKNFTWSGVRGFECGVAVVEIDTDTILGVGYVRLPTSDSEVLITWNKMNLQYRSLLEEMVQSLVCMDWDLFV